MTPTRFDEALGEALEDGNEELRERLLTGAATAEDRREARGSLDEVARRRFDLAHPVFPREAAREVDAGEIQIEASGLGDAKAWKGGSELIRDRLVDALEDERRGSEIVVSVAIRLLPEAEEEN
jgi:hypothetical protein